VFVEKLDQMISARLSVFLPLPWIRQTKDCPGHFHGAKGAERIHEDGSLLGDVERLPQRDDRRAMKETRFGEALPFLKSFER
jgi:hypothetical protein